LDVRGKGKGKQGGPWEGVFVLVCCLSEGYLFRQAAF
jgi:hypothetical protein